MRNGLAGVGVALLSLVALPVAAQMTSDTLFQHKHWKVDVVGFEDGSFACLAEVSSPGESFTIWTYPDQSVRLQFYSTQWEFGESGDTANLKVQVDRRAPWTLTNAELYKNSVLFTLPDNNEGVRLLVEVARGNRLYLRSASGEDVQWYSLAGSSASIQALIDCGEVIDDATPGNPFN